MVVLFAVALLPSAAGAAERVWAGVVVYTAKGAATPGAGGPTFEVDGVTRFEFPANGPTTIFLSYTNTITSPTACGTRIEVYRYTLSGPEGGPVGVDAAGNVIGGPNVTVSLDGSYGITTPGVWVNEDRSVSDPGRLPFCIGTSVQFHGTVHLHHDSIDGTSGGGALVGEAPCQAGLPACNNSISHVPPGTKKWFLSPCGRALDSDGDGLSDCRETDLGTAPQDADSDDDGLDDGDEVGRGTNPLDSDSDDDGLLDGAEVGLGTNPLVADTDGDGLSDGDEVGQGSDPVDPNDPGAPCGGLELTFDADWLSGGTTVAFHATHIAGATYTWNFGDGTGPRAAGPDVNYQYSAPGEYSVSVVATATGRCGTLSGIATEWVTADPIRTYAPEVTFHPDEIYYPGEASVFISQSTLVYDDPEADLSCPGNVKLARGSEVIKPTSLPLIQPARLASGSVYSHTDYSVRRIPLSLSTECVIDGVLYANGNPDTVVKLQNDPADSGFVLDLVGNTVNADDPAVIRARAGINPSIRTPPVYTVHLSEKFVQYWFFSPYNDWNATLFGHVGPHIRERHEGDWEHIVVRLDSKSVAREVALYQHYCPGEIVPRPATFGGERHIQVWAALGGHASYPRNVGVVGAEGSCMFGNQGPDRSIEGAGDRTGSGAIWQTWLNIIDATTEPWWGFGGSWGDRVPGSAGGVYCVCNFGPPAPGPIRALQEDIGNAGAAIPPGWAD